MICRVTGSCCECWEEIRGMAFIWKVFRLFMGRLVPIYFAEDLSFQNVRFRNFLSLWADYKHFVKSLQLTEQMKMHITALNSVSTPCFVLKTLWLLLKHEQLLSAHISVHFVVLFSSCALGWLSPRGQIHINTCDWSLFSALQSNAPFGLELNDWDLKSIRLLLRTCSALVRSCSLGIMRHWTS